MLYLHYALDNGPAWYRAIWRISDAFRTCLSRQAPRTRRLASEAIAALIYWPLARLTALLRLIGSKSDLIPLAYYADKSYYVMRTDAYDRFCTALEQRFTRQQIETMMRNAGLTEIRFSDRPPYWCAVGLRAG